MVLERTAFRLLCFSIRFERTYRRPAPLHGRRRRRRRRRNLRRRFVLAPPQHLHNRRLGRRPLPQRVRLGRQRRRRLAAAVPRRLRRAARRLDSSI